VIAILMASAIAIVLSISFTRALMWFFARLGKGQPILGAEDRGPTHHMHKQGTPTMGGIAILLAAFFGWLIPPAREGLVFSDQALFMWLAIVILAVIGFLDDYLKVRRQHNRGIFWKKKGWITFGIVVALMWLMAAQTGVSETISFTRAEVPGWDVSTPVWVIWTALMVWATTNAVNVTDGLDGLAAGSAMFGFGAFGLIAYFAFRNSDIYSSIVNPLDLAVLAAAMAGACGGFLWWNAAPARIMMGDVGALGIGAALGLLAVTTNTHFLLPIICGINVMEAGSRRVVERSDSSRCRRFTTTSNCRAGQRPPSSSGSGCLQHSALQPEWHCSSPISPTRFVSSGMQCCDHARVRTRRRRTQYRTLSLFAR
jgi:phospho-N-acetylmuramoyl-pentapeptide-transferase